MSWYSASRVHAAAQFLADHPSSPDKSSCWKSASFLCPGWHLNCFRPLASHLFSPMFPVTSSTWGTAFMATTQVTLMPLVMMIRAVVWFFTMTATHLLLVVISVQVFLTHQAVRQAGSILLLQGLHHVHVATQKHGLHLAMYDLWWKSVDLFLLSSLDSLVQVGQIHGSICSFLTLYRELCSVRCQQVGYSWPV